MNRSAWLIAAMGAACLSFCAVGISPCEYKTVESSLETLTLQGSFQWYEDPYADDRESLLHGVLNADYVRFVQSERFGYRLDGMSAVSWSTAGLGGEISFAGDVKSYWERDLFVIGALDVGATEGENLTVDLTTGLGWGRFQNVTSLAKAIRMQDALLDLLLLVAPLTDDVLKEMAQTIGDPALDDEARILRLEELLTKTGLLSDGALGAEGILELERILVETGDSRLCGWDLQARVGASWGSSGPVLSEAIVLMGNVAQVPDPVSQWKGSVRWISGFLPLERFGIDLTASYFRRLGEQWQLRLGYSFQADVGWSTRGEDVFEHRVWATGWLRLSSRLSLSCDGEIRYQTGDEELTRTILVRLDYDVF